MRTAAAVVLALMLAGTGNVASAQRRPASGGGGGSGGGFWYALGLAPGWARVTCQLCGGRRETGISAFLGLGGSASRALRIGGELAAWRQSDEAVTQTLMSVGAITNWYPAGKPGGLYLRAGATLVMHRASDGTDVVTSSGIGPQLGVGYEYAVSSRWLLAPFAHYSVGVFAGDVKFNGGQATSSATVSFLQVGASVTRR